MDFWKLYLVSFDYETRRQFTNEMIHKGEVDEKYDTVTLSIDGTHNLIRRSKSHSQQLYSYKTKDTAYNILVKLSIFSQQLVMLMNGWWIWIGNPVGASETNDIGLAKKEIKELKNLFEPRDLMIGDRAFRSLQTHIPIICGWIKPRGRPLSGWQQVETSQISNQRGCL